MAIRGVCFAVGWMLAGALAACVPPQGGGQGAAPGQGAQPGQLGAQGPAGEPGATGGGATCATTCQKTLQCLNAYTEADQSACASSCQQGNPAQGRLDHMQSLSCQDLIAFLKGEQQQQQQGAGQSAPRPQGTCGADCRGCVGDGTSCYHGTGLPCDACCCGPGGPAPVWK